MSDRTFWLSAFLCNLAAGAALLFLVVGDKTMSWILLVISACYLPILFKESQRVKDTNGDQKV